MDAKGAPPDPVAAQLVAYRLDIIKTFMPNVLACIRDRAQHYGPDAFTLVRRGLRGEPGCFYAIEGGHVVGTPLGMDRQALQGAADFMAIFGCAHVCIWPERVWRKPQEGGGGAD